MKSQKFLIKDLAIKDSLYQAIIKQMSKKGFGESEFKCYIQFLLEIGLQEENKR